MAPHGIVVLLLVVVMLLLRVLLLVVQVMLLGYGHHAHVAPAPAAVAPGRAVVHVVVHRVVAGAALPLVIAPPTSLRSGVSSTEQLQGEKGLG